MDRVFRTRDQVERLLALDCVATVPKIKVAKQKGDRSGASNIKVGEPNGSLPPAQNTQADELNGGLPSAPNIEISEGNGDSMPAPSVTVSEPSGGLLPAPTIKVSEGNDDASPAPNLTVGESIGGLPPAPRLIVGEPIGEFTPAPSSNVGEPNGETTPAVRLVDGLSDPRIIARRDELLWQVVDYPLSPYAEGIRSIKMAVDLTRARLSKKARKPKKILGITSSSPSEGKSTIAASLAQLISQSGKRVILVDCDLRAPRLTRVMAPDAKAGILEVLSGDASLQDVIWTDESRRLSFLPAVATARISHTAEIIGADEMRTLFDSLRGTYDYIIVDLTPLVPIIDVRATEVLVDYYVFVIEWGRTKIDLVERSLKEAAGIYNKILGVVLNKVDGSELKRYEGYGGYDYDKYYSR
jgi:capsular exopolysaccharide synthesis family protein